MKPENTIPLIALLSFGCATTPGAHPHEMSSSEHEAAARSEEKTAAGHAALHVPNDSVRKEQCTPRSGSSLRTGLEPEVCWASITNPTDVHTRAAEEHRRHAAAHRAGSSALREAEARACVGITPDDRDISPFEHVEDLESVTSLDVGGSKNRQTVGAIVTFRAVRGMTAEWLQRVVDCHLARNASLGHVVAEMPSCPLVPDGITATVTSAGNGFAVAVRANDPGTAREVLARARRLLPGGSGSSASHP